MNELMTPELEKFRDEVIDLVMHPDHAELDAGQVATILLSIAMNIARRVGSNEIHLLDTIWTKMRDITLAEVRN